MDQRILAKLQTGGKIGRTAMVIGLSFGNSLLVLIIVVMLTGQLMLSQMNGSRDYICLRRDSSLLAQAQGRAGFDSTTLKELAALPGVRAVVPVMRANVQVLASVELPGQTFSSLIFLEAIPSEHLDTNWGNLNANATGTMTDPIPILISQTFLFLYNGTFAPAYGLPSVQAGMLTLVPIRLELRGNRATRTVMARIVGVTRRLDTILVPETFISSLNLDLNASDDTLISDKVLLWTNAGEHPDIKAYSERNGLEVAGNAFDKSPLVELAIGIIVGMSIIAIIIVVLAIGQLLLSIQLLVHKQRSMYEALITWGYSWHELKQAEWRRLVPNLVISVLIAWFTIGLVSTVLLGMMGLISVISLVTAAITAILGPALAGILAVRILNQHLK